MACVAWQAAAATHTLTAGSGRGQPPSAPSPVACGRGLAVQPDVTRARGRHRRPTRTRSSRGVAGRPASGARAARHGRPSLVFSLLGVAAHGTARQAGCNPGPAKPTATTRYAARPRSGRRAADATGKKKPRQPVCVRVRRRYCGFPWTEGGTVACVTGVLDDLIHILVRFRLATSAVLGSRDLARQAQQGDGTGGRPQPRPAAACARAHVGKGSSRVVSW